MIDIQALLVVAGSSILGAALVVTLCSVGLRLLVTRAVITGDDERSEAGRPPVRRRPLPATIGAYACFVCCGVTVLVAIYLIVPSLHG